MRPPTESTRDERKDPDPVTNEDTRPTEANDGESQDELEARQQAWDREHEDDPGRSDATGEASGTPGAPDPETGQVPPTDPATGAPEGAVEPGTTVPDEQKGGAFGQPSPPPNPGDGTEQGEQMAKEQLERRSEAGSDPTPGADSDAARDAAADRDGAAAADKADD